MNAKKTISAMMMTVALMAAIPLVASTGTAVVTVSAQQQTGEHCFNDVQGGVVIGVTCFPTKEECKDFRNEIKGSSDETRFTPCKPSGA